MRKRTCPLNAQEIASLDIRSRIDQLECDRRPQLRTRTAIREQAQEDVESVARAGALAAAQIDHRVDFSVRCLLAGRLQVGAKLRVIKPAVER